MKEEKTYWNSLKLISVPSCENSSFLTVSLTSNTNVNGWVNNNPVKVTIQINDPRVNRSDKIRIDMYYADVKDVVDRIKSQLSNSNVNTTGASVTFNTALSKNTKSITFRFVPVRRKLSAYVIITDKVASLGKSEIEIDYNDFRKLYMIMNQICDNYVSLCGTFTQGCTNERLLESVNNIGAEIASTIEKSLGSRIDSLGKCLNSIKHMVSNFENLPEKLESMMSTNKVEFLNDDSLYDSTETDSVIYSTSGIMEFDVEDEDFEVPEEELLDVVPHSDPPLNNDFKSDPPTPEESYVTPIPMDENGNVIPLREEIISTTDNVIDFVNGKPEDFPKINLDNIDMNKFKDRVNDADSEISPQDDMMSQLDFMAINEDLEKLEESKTAIKKEPLKFAWAVGVEFARTWFATTSVISDGTDVESFAPIEHIFNFFGKSKYLEELRKDPCYYEAQYHDVYCIKNTWRKQIESSEPIPFVRRAPYRYDYRIDRDHELYDMAILCGIVSAAYCLVMKTYSNISITSNITQSYGYGQTYSDRILLPIFMLIDFDKINMDKFKEDIILKFTDLNNDNFFGTMFEDYSMVMSNGKLEINAVNIYNIIDRVVGLTHKSITYKTLSVAYNELGIPFTKLYSVEEVKQRCINDIFIVGGNTDGRDPKLDFFFKCMNAVDGVDLSYIDIIKKECKTWDDLDMLFRFGDQPPEEYIRMKVVLDLNEGIDKRSIILQKYNGISEAEMEDNGKLYTEDGKVKPVPGLFKTLFGMDEPPKETN